MESVGIFSFTLVAYRNMQSMCTGKRIEANISYMTASNIDINSAITPKPNIVIVVGGGESIVQCSAEMFMTICRHRRVFN